MDDDTDDKDDSKRKSRNLSEKKRRDQFNLLVNELSSMVSSTNRKMDKSTVLKSTIAYLKHHNEIAIRSRAHEIQEDWKPSYLSNEEFTHLILEALDGFIIVFSSTGRIFYASESITSLLGHLPSDLLNMTIYDLAYEEDHSKIYNILLNPVSVIDPIQNGLARDCQVSFTCHLKRRGLDFRDEVTFELVQFVGYFRGDIDIENIVPNTRGGHHPKEGDTQLIFIGTGRLQAPQLIRDMSIVDSSKSEFTSRHSLEWKFLFLDHRAPPIIGYLPFEVLGTSGYDYYHFDDLEKVILCHEALMQKGEGTSCYYRFLTKGQQWIWLQTRFYITYHQWNSKPEFVVCTHRVVSYVDVMKQLRNSVNNNTNNGPCVMRDTDDSDTLVEKQTHSSSSDIQNPPTWISKSSRSSRIGTTPKSPSVRNRSRYSAYQGNGSDSGSMSGESPISRNSMITHYGTQRARLRQHQQQQSQQQKIHRQQQEQQQQRQTPGHSISGLNQITSQQMHHQPHVRALRPPPIIAPTYIEQQHYLAAIPVQPVIGPAFTPAAAVVSPIQPSVELVTPGTVMTTTQSQLQDQLQRKHEELQQLIVQQQEELRRVSEQLLMARYGLLQPMVPVSNVISNTTDQTGSQQQQMHHIDSHHQQGNAILIGAVDQQQPQNLQNVDQKDIDPALRQAEGDEMVSYMQLTPVGSSHFHHLRLGTERQDNNEQQQTQPMGIPNELEILPYQMSQEQSQILFNSPNSPGHNL